MTRFNAEFRAAVIAIAKELKGHRHPEPDQGARAVVSYTCSVCGEHYRSFAALIAHERREDHGPLRLRGRA